MTLNEWSSIAQIAATIIGFIGIVVSIYLSTKALREVQLDRKLRYTPHLAFEGGGWQLPVEFVKAGRRIPGLNPGMLDLMLADQPDDAESVRLKVKKDKDGFIERGTYGHLRNHGAGPALETEITWIPEKIWIGSDLFVVDEAKRMEPVYNEKLNRWPSIPSNIQSGEEAGINCLPAFIVRDFEKKITRVDGMLEITCLDVFKQRHITRQKYHLFTGYKEKNTYVHVTFSDILTENQ